MPVTKRPGDAAESVSTRVKVTAAGTALSMFLETKTRPVDVAFLAMAVSDFEPEPYAGKLDSDVETTVIRGRRTPKVIRSVRDWSGGTRIGGALKEGRCRCSDRPSTAY